MHKHNGMRPQDVVILLKIMTYQNQLWTMANIASSLNLSASEVTVAMERNRVAGLIDQKKKVVNKEALRNFLIYGLKYVFPPQIGYSTRGVATARSASPIKEFVNVGMEEFVWPHYKGRLRGNSIVPLYPKIPKFIESDPQLYEYLVIIDALRVCPPHVIDVAISELNKRFQKYNPITKEPPQFGY